MKKTNNKKKQKSRIRGRHEVGVGGAVKAIQNYDYEQQMAAALEVYQQRQQQQQGPAQDTNLPNLPSFEELVDHWKINPDSPGQLMNDLDGGKWKIVIPTEQIYETCMMELKNLEWSDFAEFKLLMLEKYYIDEWMLDCLVKSDDEKDTEKGGGGK